MKRMPRALTALPVFNEAKYVESVLDEVRKTSAEILVVDDGSSDATAQILARRHDIQLVTHQENQGYGAALRTAFQFAIESDYDVLVTIDCDGQHEPERIPRFVEACEAVDIVSGSRYLQRFQGDSAPPPELLEIRPSAIVLPEYLSDEFLAPFARSKFRCTIVVKDATRIRVSPVCHTAWSKTGGRLAVMEPMRLLAVATNPVTATGPDADAGAFRDLVAEALPDVPVHDVANESGAEDRRSKWRFWS